MGGRDRTGPAPRRRAATGLASLAVAGLLLAACGGDGDTEASGPSPTAEDAGSDAAAEPGTIVAADFALSSATVAPGAEVTVRNDDSVAHTVTADDGSFDTGTVAAGEATTFTAPSEPGEVPYHCEIHPGMTGTLTIG